MISTHLKARYIGGLSIEVAFAEVMQAISECGMCMADDKGFLAAHAPQEFVHPRNIALSRQGLGFRGTRATMLYEKPLLTFKVTRKYARPAFEAGGVIEWRNVYKLEGLFANELSGGPDAFEVVRKIGEWLFSKHSLVWEKAVSIPISMARGCALGIEFENERDRGPVNEAVYFLGETEIDLALGNHGRYLAKVVLDAVAQSQELKRLLECERPLQFD